MSIQFKIPFYILAFFLVNVLFIGLYYNLSLAHTISDNYLKNQAVLQERVTDIAAEMDGGKDYRQILDRLAQGRELKFSVTDLRGNVIYETGSVEGVNLDITATGAFMQNGSVYLLRMTQPQSLGFLSSFSFVTDLFIGEMVIISFTLIMLTVIIYFKMVRPLVSLQRDMRQYKKGIKPKRVSSDDEIGTLRNDFVDLTDALEEQKQRQNRIVASISHDIKTPLTSVMGYTEQLQKSSVSHERREKYLATIYAKSQNIKELVEEFDDYIGLQMQSQLKKQTITAQRLCQIIEDDYREDLSSAGAKLTVICDCPDNLLDVDVVKINRVFGNAVANSIRYAKDTELSIEIRCSKAGKDTLFSVSDTGAGVDDGDLDRIFEPFYTSDQSRRVAGLGLSICKSIVESHGGMIWARNREEGGFSVYFTLPNLRQP